ncbi:disease resistance protein RPP13-like [Macadamia integrifolia]|uniref:disease resistance protein RPP13-like n=1 Tax=Macadamia integrifolia TaxID=60698 RepID=UPI001C4FFA2B|nr:disease resistance protein RPP13-like [Macadamia integrifolia]
MGKTTLARKVYNDRNIKEHFPCRLWIHVSSDYKMEELLQDIIKQILINDDEEERKKMSLKDLAIEIYKLLKTTPTRYLVVFDDVCTIQFWADIHMLFPNNKNKEVKVVVVEVG